MEYLEVAEIVLEQRHLESVVNRGMNFRVL